jgi:hypothetical protein
MARRYAVCVYERVCVCVCVCVFYCLHTSRTSTIFFLFQRRRGTHARAAQAFVSVGNPDELQIEGAITIEACIKNEADPRPGQRMMPHRNIVAHGHDRVTEVFLRVNLFTMQYEVGSWVGTLLSNDEVLV